MKEIQISKTTKEKAEAAKRFIQKKYSMNQIKAEQRAEQWKIFTQKISQLQLSSKQEEQAKRQVIHEEMNQLRKRRQKVSKKNFTSLSVIGRGAFGEVRLCRENKSGRVVAIKCLKKKEMIKKNQQNHLRDQRNILVDGSQWIVKLLYSFQDAVYLYLVMQFLPGGDLMTLLINNNVINEEQARFYVAQTIISLQSVHKLNYIHRDLKPDNILIGCDGHIKLSDFGLCKKTDINQEDDKHNYHKLRFKQNQNQFTDKFSKMGIVSYQKMLKLKKRDRKLAFSAVGTPDYIAPEMLTRKGYDQSVDWWSVGIMLYQMLIGYAPFTAQNNQQIYYKIQNFNQFLYFPPQVNLTKQVIDLISRLVTKSDIRLGKNGAGEIKTHAWFKGIDWNNIRKMKAPFIPETNDEIDTRYFDDYDEQQPWLFDGPQNYRKDFNFIGYTYKDEQQNKNEEIFDNIVQKLENEKQKEMQKQKFRLEGLRKNMKKKNNYGQGKNYVSRKVLQKSINLMNKSQICTQRSKNTKSKSPICERQSIGLGKKKMTKSPLNIGQKSSNLLKKTQLTYSTTLFQRTQQLPSRKSINTYK